MPASGDFKNRVNDRAILKQSMTLMAMPFYALPTMSLSVSRARRDWGGRCRGRDGAESRIQLRKNDVARDTLLSIDTAEDYAPKHDDIEGSLRVIYSLIIFLFSHIVLQRCHARRRCHCQQLFRLRFHAKDAVIGFRQAIYLMTPLYGAIGAFTSRALATKRHITISRACPSSARRRDGRL